MPNTAPLEALADELGAIAGRFERETSLRIDAALADLRRIDAERELRLTNLERLVIDRLAAVKDGQDGAAGERGADGTSVGIEDIAPVIAGEIARVLSAIPKPQDGAPGRDGVDGKDIDADAVERMIEERVTLRFSAIPPARDGLDGKSVTMEDVRPLIDQVIIDAVAALPPARDGKDADMEALRAEARDAAAVAVSEIPVARDGKDADQAAILDAVMVAAREHLAALPVPQDGRPVTVEEVMPVIKTAVAEAVTALPPAKDGRDGKDGERGADGSPGKLPIVKAWSEGVSYEGEVFSHAGATYQAVRDTGRAPPHEDWILLASAGSDGRSFSVKGTYTKSAEYAALDVVALNGASFVALRDAPGECPGADWQLLCMQGKTGKPGDRGAPGPKGDRGAPGPAVVRIDIDGDGLQTFRSADGSTATCDLYPVLSQIISA